MGWDFSLSASKLNLLADCQRCFYDANVLKIERPRGLFPSLPSGVDRAMKDYCDKYRQSLPPQLVGKIAGKLWGSVAQISKLRHWKSGLKVEMVVAGKTINLIGALDDLIFEENDSYSPYDIKTKGKLPEDDGSKYYGLQCDIYALLLQENGLPPSGKAYLDYHFPVIMDGGAITFDHKLFTLTTDTNRARTTIEKAVTLMLGKQPPINYECEYCRFAQPRVDAALKASQQGAALCATA